MYIGQTEKSLVTRWQQHYHAMRAEPQRPLYQALAQQGFQNWIIAPLERVTDVANLDKRERHWMHHFRHYLVNDPRMWTLKPVRSKVRDQLMPQFKTPQRDSSSRRIDRRKAGTREYRQKTKMILYTELWRTWAPTTMLNYLCTIKTAKLPRKILSTVSARVRAAFTLTYGFPLRAEYSCKLATAKNLKRGEIKNYICSIIRDFAPFSLIGKYIRLHCSIVLENHKSLQTLISNSKRTLENSDHHLRDCPCKNFPDLPRSGEHILVRGTSLPDSHSKLRDLLSLSKKNPVTLQNREYLGTQLLRIKTFLISVGIQQNQLPTDFTDHLLPFLWRKKTTASLLEKFRIIRTIEPYRSLTFIEIDKNVNSWALICPTFYRQLCSHHFGDTAHYKPIELPEKEIRKKIIAAYESMKLHHLVNGIKPLRFWEIGTAKLLPKNKDLLKLRPLVSYFHFYSRPLGKVVSRCLTVLIRHFSKEWNTMELTHVKDLPKRLRILNQFPKWFDNDPASITFVKTDIKNQFTNLNKDEVLGALKFMLLEATSIMKRSFAIRRREKEKRSDHAGTGRTRDFWNVPFSIVLRYAMFELETPFFRIGDDFFFQTNGLPMGGFLSANLAVIFSMVRERNQPRLWRHLLWPSKAFRFRDDIFKGLISHQQAEDIRGNLQTLYSPSLEVELEAFSPFHTNFLEYWVQSSSHGLTSWHYNKNFDLIFDSTSKAIIRYPDISADIPLIYFKSIIQGLIHKTIKCATTTEGIITGIVQACHELFPKRYPIKWITNAIHRTKHPAADSLCYVAHLTFTHLALFLVRT